MKNKHKQATYLRHLHAHTVMTPPYVCLVLSSEDDVFLDYVTQGELHKVCSLQSKHKN